MANTKVTSDNLDTNIDIAGTFDVTGATTLDAGATIVGSGTGAGLYLNGTNSDSIAQGNFVRYGTNFLTQSDAANDDLITYAFNGSTFVNALNIKSNGNIGIKQSAPSSPNGATDFLHIGNSSSTYSSLILEDNNNTWEIFQNNQFSIRDGTDTRLLIDTSGKVGIGVSDPLNKLEVRGNVSISASGTGSKVLDFRSGDTLSAFIEKSGNNLTFYNADDGLIRFSTNDAAKWTIESNGHLKAAADGIGINFEASKGSGETSTVLDDYEEGSWTIGVSSSDPGSMGVTVSNGYGFYTKIGNLVTVGGSFDLSLSSPQGFMRITGLPFSCSSNGTRPLYVGNVGYTVNVVPQPDKVTLGNGSSESYLDVWKAGNNSRYSIADWDNGGRMNFQITYEAA